MNGASRSCVASGDLIGKGLAQVISLNESIGHGAGTGAILVSPAAFSSVTDNIPLSAMLAKILQAQDTASTDPLWWSVVFDANLGGNLTPIGSASTLVWARALLRLTAKACGST